MVNPDLQRAMRIVGQHLDEIQHEVFKADAGMKFTFIARDPNDPEADFLMSDDDLYQVILAVTRSLRREDVKTGPSSPGES